MYIVRLVFQTSTNRIILISTVFALTEFSFTPPIPIFTSSCGFKKSFMSFLGWDLETDKNYFFNLFLCKISVKSVQMLSCKNVTNRLTFICNICRYKTLRFNGILLQYLTKNEMCEVTTNIWTKPNQTMWKN